MTGDEELGRRIRTARDEAGLTQAQLAHRIGLHDAQSVSNYERGVTDVPRERLRRMCATLDKPLSYFIDEPSVVPDPMERLERIEEGVGELLRAHDLAFALLVELREAVARLEDRE